MKHFVIICLAFSSIFLPCLFCWSQTTYTWSGGTGNWSNTTNWTPQGLPTTSDTVVFNVTSPVSVCTIDQNAFCGKLLMNGSGSVSSSGPLLQFSSSGSITLTVEDSLRITGGSGGGSGNRGGRAKLTSNGNASAVLEVRGTVYATCSNSSSYGYAGLNINEGTTILSGAGSATLFAGASTREANLIIGDGTNSKTVTFVSTDSYTTWQRLWVTSLRVRSNATFLIGGTASANGGYIGNAAVASDVINLTGGILIDSGATMAVNSTTNTANTFTVELMGGGITNNGTIVTSATNRALNFDITGTNSNVISGTNPITFDTLKLNTSMGATFAQSATIGQTLLLTLGTLTVDSDTLNISANGSIAATSGSLAGGTVNFLGAGTVSGTVVFNNVVMNADSLDFGTASTISGVFQINGGGVKWGYAPTYGTNSTLKYAITCARSAEWTSTWGTTWSSPGYPYNVQVSNNSTLDIGARSADVSTVWRTYGDLIIDSGSTVTMNGTNQMQAELYVSGSVFNNGTLTLSEHSNGDIIVGGDWIKGSSAVFNTNGKAVRFIGSGTQTIKSANGSESFSLVYLTKPSGSVILSSNPATSITINTTGWRVLWLWDGGNMDLNGQTMTLAGDGGEIHVNDTARAITGPAGSTIVFNGTKSVVVENGGSLTIDSNVTVKVNGSGVSFGETNTTIKGTLEILSGGSIASSGAPLYASGSTLEYNTGGTYSVGNEWYSNTTSGVGVPWNVTIAAGTSLNHGSVAYPRTVLGTLRIDGSLTLSSAWGGDLNVGGDWTRSSTGQFNCNVRCVFFNGAGTQTLSSYGGETFDRIWVSKPSGNLILANNMSIVGIAYLGGGNVVTNSDTLIIGASASVTDWSGWVVGNLKKVFSTGAQSFTYDIGDSTNHTPVAVQINNVTASGGLTARTVSTEHPQIASSGIDPTKSVNRYYSFSRSGLTYDYSNVTFTFASSDVDAGANPDNFVVRKYTGAYWIQGTVGSRTATSIQYLYTGSLMDYAIGEPLAGPWTEQTSGTTATLTSVCIVDDQVAWACGGNGTVVRTTNGGTTWSTATLLPSDAHNIFAVDVNTALVCVNPSSGDDGRIYRTTDAGTTWSLVYQNTGTGAFMDAVHMFDTTNGVALGDPVSGLWVLLKTSDGGMNWSPLSSLSQYGAETAYNNCFEWVGTQYGWFGSCCYPWIYRTTDGGSTWSMVSKQGLNASGTYTISMINDSVGLASGGPMSATTNGGVSWDSVSTFAGYYIAGMDVPTERWWSAWPNKLIYLSTDRGKSWSVSQTGPSPYQHMKMKKILSANVVVGYAVGDNGMIYRYSEVYASSIIAGAIGHGSIVPSGTVHVLLDSNQTFTFVPDSGYFVDSVFIDGAYDTSRSSYTFHHVTMGHSISVQFAPILYCTTQRGWNMVSVPVSARDFTKSSLFPAACSRAFCYEGYYQPKDTMINGLGYWLKFRSDSTISLIGAPKHLDTVDVGAGWNIIGSISDTVVVSQIVSPTSGLTTSQFFGYRNRYIVSDSILPGRAYWVRVSEAGELILSASPSLSMLEKNAIKIVQSNELPPSPPDEIGGATTAVPTEYALDEAYPNPFNPTTTIEYQLPVESKVSLKVYNTLGQVVATLVDGVQSASYQSVEWNATYAASGVYFYKLDAVSITDLSKTFTQVKKMLLVK